MAVWCGMPTIQYSARSARLSMRLSKWAWPKIIMPHLIYTNWNKMQRDKTQQLAANVSAALLTYQWPTMCSSVTWHPTSQKILGEVSCTECTGQGNDWIDSNGKMKTRHPIEGSIRNEFPSIYNHCGVMAAWNRKTFEKIPIFVIFWKNDPLWGNFQNSVPQGFIASPSPIDVLCSNFVKFGRWEIGKIVRCLLSLLDEKISPRSPLLATARIAPKICQASPRECTQSAPDFIQIGPLSAELYPNAWTPSKRSVKCFQYSAET